MKKISQLFILTLALQACSRGQTSQHKSQTTPEQIQASLYSSAPVMALNSQQGQTLVHGQSVEDSGIRSEKFKHYDNGIEVLGSSVSYHEMIDHPENSQISAHISNIYDSDLVLVPNISAEKAVTLAQSLEGGQALGAPTLKILPAKKNRLIYQVDLDSGKQVWIDAQQATHIATLTNQNSLEGPQLSVVSALNKGIKVSWDQDLQNNSCQVSSLNPKNFQLLQTLDASSCQDLIKNSCQALKSDGTPASFNPSVCAESPAVDDPSAERATRNAQKFLNYFREIHNRNSFDGNGSQILSIVHAGQNYPSAAWYKNKQFLAYGDGDGITTRDFTFAIDVAAHELTHGVIQATAGLIAMGETGALNESIADFFGKMVEGQDNWTIGASLGLGLNPIFPGIRDLKDPSRLQGSFLDSANIPQNKPYPSTRAQEAPTVYPCKIQNDFCAVHYNATIPGHAWYGIYQVLGKEKTEKLLYATLTHFLTELADFEAASSAIEQACPLLFSTSECKAVKSVLEASGMTAPSFDFDP